MCHLSGGNRALKSPTSFAVLKVTRAFGPDENNYLS
jgi:hypothetical protein